jgi:hypothetical protein
MPSRNDRAWKFREPPNEAVVTSRHVTEKTKPILMVSHYSGEDGWAFLTGEAFSTDEGQLVSLEQIVSIDPSVEQLADLPPGWSAQRKSLGEKWHRFEDSEI